MSITTAADYPVHAKRNFIAYAILMLCLVAVHFIIAASHATRSVSQAAVFSWPGLAIIGGLGLVGIFFTNLARLPGVWDPEISLGTRLWRPLGLGLASGALALGLDLATGRSQELATKMHLQSIHIVFPLSVPIYFGGAILVTIIYFLVLIPFVVWLFSRVVFKGRHKELIYWLIAIPCAFIEPITQNEISEAMKGGTTDIINLLPDVGLLFGQVWFLRRGGLVASILVRIGYYLFSHIAIGLIQGVY